MKKIKLTESDLKRVIKNSVVRILKEDYHFDNFTGADEGGIDGGSDIEASALNVIRENESDYDILNYPEVEDISAEELASCVAELITKARNGEDVTSSIGYNTITIDEDRLYLESDDTGEEISEGWAGNIADIIGGEDGDLEYAIETIASSINSCWYEIHQDEIDSDVYYDEDDF